MDWRREILDHGAALGRATYEDPIGVGVDFEDGCDAFWVLPAEVTSTLPVPPVGPSDLATLLAAYDAIGRLRERALHVVRHYAASLGYRLNRSRSGSWGIESEGGVSSSLSLGAYVTGVARDTGDVYNVVTACVRNSILHKVPTRKRIDRYLNTPGPPASEAPIVEREPIQLIPRTIAGALGWMGVCRALENPEQLTSPDAIKAAAAPTGRIGRMLLRLADRLPQVDAGIDLLKPGVLSIKFDDGFDDFDVNARARPLARRVGADGPEAVGDQLADEFLMLNAARSRVLRAIWQAAAAWGWRKQEIGLAFLGIERTVHLGTDRREVSFSVEGPLTGAVRNDDPEAALRRIFQDAPDFAEACVAALRDPRQDAPAELPDATLSPRDVPPAPPLRAMTPAVVADMDRFAQAELRGYLTAERTIWEYRNRDVYEAKADTWAARDDWVRVAERHLGTEWPHPMAMLILLDAGDPRGDRLAREYLAKAYPHHEVSDAEVEIVWRYRHELPDAARQWFTPQQHDDVPFATQRAALGDPVALRKASIEGAETVADDAQTTSTFGPRPRLTSRRSAGPDCTAT